jgi:uncharacterized delta-60 repeat protein
MSAIRRPVAALVLLLAACLGNAADAAARPGTLDQTFGDGGTLLTGFGDATAQNPPSAGVRLPDGKFLMIANSVYPTTALVRFDATGRPDPTFDEDGVVSLPAQYAALAVQPDGKILLGGAFGSPSALVARLTADGAPDPTFGGGDGIATLADQGTVRKIAIQPDGKILLAAEYYVEIPPCTRLGCGSKPVRYLARLDQAGNPDSSFAGGDAMTDVVDGLAIDLALQPDGGILDASSASIRRLAADGSLDPSFGSGGSVSIGDSLQALAAKPDGGFVIAAISFSEGLAVEGYTADGQADPSVPGSRGELGLVPRTILLQPDEKILVGGRLEGFGSGFALARLEADGTPDESFGGGDGLVTTEIAESADLFSEHVIALGLEPDGRILAMGDSISRFAAARYTSQGELDGTFGEGGTTVFALRTASEDVPLAVAAQEDGKLLVGGTTDADPGHSRATKFALARYERDGSLDPTFGTGGRITIRVGPVAVPRQGVEALAVQPDGKVIAAGVRYGRLTGAGGQPPFPADPEVVLVRMLPDGSLDPTFGGGDGLVTSPTGLGVFSLALALEPDGRIVLASFRGLRRYLPDGSPDPSFGEGGATGPPGSLAGGRTHLALDARGGYVVASGRSITRFDESGALDSGFGNEGEVQLASPIEVRALDVGADGEILAVGSILRTLTLHRFGSDGSPDRRFGGGDGFVGIRLNSIFEALAAEVQPDGRIVAAGVSSNAAGISVIRFNPDGRRDRSFVGEATGRGPIAEQGLRLASMSDGGVALVGVGRPPGGSGDFAVARYLGGGPPPIRCGDSYATEVGTSGADLLRGTSRQDVFAGLGGRDRLFGFSGRDVLCGGRGNDRLFGGDNTDMLLGGRGIDLLVGGGGRDFLRGGPGRDRMIAAPGRDRVRP